ncbi:MAG: hypothetical protein WA622_00550 [Mycobacterium sp.]|uniref:hypothetical protein n=1 Tax=Mycobacterium sp. TaxID=1785 RepID=UPI003BB75BF2
MATDAYRVSGKIKAACRFVRAMARRQSRPEYRNIVCQVRSLGGWLRARGVDRREFRCVVGGDIGRCDGVREPGSLTLLYAVSLTVVPGVDR